MLNGSNLNENCLTRIYFEVPSGWVCQHYEATLLRKTYRYKVYWKLFEWQISKWPKMKWHEAEIEFWAELRILGTPRSPPATPFPFLIAKCCCFLPDNKPNNSWLQTAVNWTLPAGRKQIANGNRNFINLLTPTQRRLEALEWRPAQSRNELKAQQDNKEWQWLGYDSGCYWSFFIVVVVGVVCVTHAHVSRGSQVPGLIPPSILSNQHISAYSPIDPT